MKRLDLSGTKFGRLEVIGLSGISRHKDGRAFTEWNVRCICGAVFPVQGSTLRFRTRDVCNKCRRESNPPNFRHGLRKTREYENPKNNKYYRYGGRGIKFLFSSFEEFFKELGPRPEGFVIDRTDNEGNYEPGNVQWVNRSQSIRNSSRCLKN